MPTRIIAALERVSISWTRIADLTPLANHRNLESLTAFSTPISDLTPLFRAKNLRRLLATHSPVHMPDVAELRKRNPDSEIYVGGMVLRENRRGNAGVTPGVRPAPSVRTRPRSGQ